MYMHQVHDPYDSYELVRVVKQWLTSRTVCELSTLPHYPLTGRETMVFVSHSVRRHQYCVHDHSSTIKMSDIVEQT